MKKKHIRIQFTRRQLNALRRADYSSLKAVPSGETISNNFKATLSKYFKTGKDPVRVNLTLHPYEITLLKKWAVAEAHICKSCMQRLQPAPLYIALIKLGGHCMRGGRA